MSVCFTTFLTAASSTPSALATAARSVRTVSEPAPYCALMDSSSARICFVRAATVASLMVRTALGGGGDTALGETVLGALGSGMSAAASMTSPRAAADARQSAWTRAVVPSSTELATHPSRTHRLSVALQPTLNASPQMRQCRGFSSGGAGIAFGVEAASAEKPVDDGARSGATTAAGRLRNDGVGGGATASQLLRPAPTTTTRPRCPTSTQRSFSPPCALTSALTPPNAEKSSVRREASMQSTPCDTMIS
mmetsp:Transcript_1553/g.4298  ORF Transcript_1553/g.4298 Transcript_1553/m.4298 type:complete len:251 (+) Transcript_1553:380-1132(+)